MRRAYKFLLRPTSRQARLLAECLEDHRQIYNAALEERREAWRIRQVQASYSRQGGQLPTIRAADPCGQGRWSAGSQQQTLRRLDKAFAAFFRRIKAGEKRPGYPRFKGRGWFDTIEWPAEKNGARWDSVWTSQKCARCGHVAEGNRASQAVFRCLACGHEAHADVNAAINILGAGLALQRAEAA